MQYLICRFILFQADQLTEEQIAGKFSGSDCFGIINQNNHKISIARMSSSTSFEQPCIDI